MPRANADHTTPDPRPPATTPITPPGDASLLAALARLTEIMNEHALAIGEEAVRRWVARNCHEAVALMDEIHATQATTIEGARARARYALMEAHNAPRQCKDAYTALRELLALGIFAGALPPRVVSPDGRLLRRCQEFMDANRRLAVLNDEAQAMPGDHKKGTIRLTEGTSAAGGNPNGASAEHEAREIWREKLQDVIETKAATHEGVRAKAAVLRSVVFNAAVVAPGRDLDIGILKAEPHERLAWSLASDIIGVPVDEADGVEAAV